MKFLTNRSDCRRAAALLALVSFLFAVPGVQPLWAESENPEEEYAMRIQEVYVSRSEGNYNEALDEIQTMIEDFANANDILRVLEDRDMPVGRYEVTWNGVNEYGQQVSSGVYFYLLEADGGQQTKKMVLLK